MAFLKWLYMGITGDGFCNDWLTHMPYQLGKTLYEVSGCGTRMSPNTVFLVWFIPFVLVVLYWNYHSLRRA